MKPGTILIDTNQMGTKGHLHVGEDSLQVDKYSQDQCHCSLHSKK